MRSQLALTGSGGDSHCPLPLTLEVGEVLKVTTPRTYGTLNPRGEAGVRDGLVQSPGRNQTVSSFIMTV